MTKRFMNSKGKILVPINLDDSSAMILRAAGQLSARTGLGIEVVHVSEYWVGRTWPTEMMLGGPLGGLVTAVEDQSMEVAAQKLRDLVKQNLPGFNVGTEVLLGYPTETIRAHALTIRAELILVGGTSDNYRFVPAGLSTVLGLMADAPCPVLVIPKGHAPHWDKPQLTAVLADDLQPESDNGVLIAYEWVSALGKTHLIHVHVNQMAKDDLQAALTTAAASAHAPTGAIDIDSVWNAAVESLDAKLKNRAPGRQHLIEARGGSCSTKVIQGEPVESILKFSADSSADLIIFGRHRTWRRKPFVVGQLPFHSMLRSQKPVLIAEH